MGEVGVGALDPPVSALPYGRTFCHMTPRWMQHKIIHLSSVHVVSLAFYNLENFMINYSECFFMFHSERPTTNLPWC